MDDIRHFSNAGSAHKTDATARHIAAGAVRHLRDNALTPAEKIEISSRVTQQAYRDALAAGKPIPDSQTVQRARQAALEAAIDQKIAGAK